MNLYLLSRLTAPDKRSEHVAYEVISSQTDQKGCHVSIELKGFYHFFKDVWKPPVADSAYDY